MHACMHVHVYSYCTWEIFEGEHLWQIRTIYQESSSPMLYIGKFSQRESLSVKIF